MIVECDTCESRVTAQVINEYDYPGGEEYPPGRVSFLRCPACSSPFLMLCEVAHGGGWDAPEQLYPKDSGDLGSEVPENVARHYSEARRCVRARAYTAAVMMCRRCLEALVADRGAGELGLFKGLKALQDRGAIDPQIVEWANELRVFGNEAAHDSSTSFLRDDAEDALIFSRAILNYVYTFREMFSEFRARRSSAKRSG